LRARTRDVIKSEHERIQTEIGLTRTLERNKLDQEFKEMHDVLEEHFKERQAALEESYKARAGDIQLELMSCEKKLKEFKDM
jgi:protein-disulfide isomerase